MSYTHSFASLTPQDNRKHHVPTRTTWTWADLEPNAHESDDLGKNHRQLECDCGRTGTETGKVRKLVVIYTHSIISSTPQDHHKHHVPTRTTWTWADLEPKRDESDDLGQNHHHLESDSGRTGTKMGKVRKLVVIYTHHPETAQLQHKHCLLTVTT